ncbi:MAG: tetratricopeptide repeat protein [Paludibacter sp.]
MKKFIFLLFSLLCQGFAMAQWNTDRILTIGQNALYFEDYVLSIQYFNQVIKIKPYLAEPYLYRAIAKLQLGDYLSADQDCTEALKINPFLPQAYYARGFARRKMEYYPEAIIDFSKALEFSPNSLYLLMNRMDAREQAKDYEGAMKDVESYLKLSPMTTNIYYEKGRIQLEMKDTTGATLSFDKFLQMDSTSSLGWSARAYLKMQKNDRDGALKDYNQAIIRKSTYVGDYINRGILNVQNKNYNQALSDYNSAIKIDNKNDLAYYNRGLLRANLGDNNNALTDLTTVLELDTTNTEARLSKAMLEMTLKDYKNAIEDYKKIIAKYKYFLPAYSGIAQAMDALGKTKEAFRYRQLAYNMEQNKDYISRKEKENIVANNKMAANDQKSSSASKTDLFNRFAAQDIEEPESKYDDKTRGAVQDKYTDVINERSFVLTYYAKSDELRQTNLYYPILEQYNKKGKLSSKLKITNNEIPLTAELINSHFEAINNISSQLAKTDTDPDIYFNRAIEFAMVLDFNSAIDDLNKAIALRPDFMLAYFYRANIRNKLVEYQKNKTDQNTNLNLINVGTSAKKITVEKQILFDVELIMRDYDKVNDLAPDFSFAYYNKANILCTQKDFKTAIADYSKSIEVDHDFAEAYFNRGLTYLFIGEDANGLADLSKAGELGIYKAYNLIQRFKK